MPDFERWGREMRGGICQWQIAVAADEFELRSCERLGRGKIEFGSPAVEFVEGVRVDGGAVLRVFWLCWERGCVELVGQADRVKRAGLLSF